MSEHFEFALRTTDGLHLYGQGWQPPGEPHAVVCLMHGLGEHSGRYVHVGEALNQGGYALVAFDLRGHGKSEGRRGHILSTEAFFGDLDLFLKAARDRYPGKPIVLYGHSLGGLVINYVVDRRPDLAGVIATSPNFRLGFDPPTFKVALGRMMNNIWPTFTQASGLETVALSRDPQVVRDYAEDALVHDRITARMFVSGIHEASLFALEHAAEFPLPLLLMHGSEDRITSVKGSQEFAAKAGDNVTLKIWEGWYHELHNEPEKDQVFAYMLGWLDGRVR